MGDTVNHRTATWTFTLWVVLRCYFAAVLLPGSCLHLYLTCGLLDTKQEPKKWHTYPQKIIPSFISIKVNTSIQ